MTQFLADTPSVADRRFSSTFFELRAGAPHCPPGLRFGIRLLTDIDAGTINTVHFTNGKYLIPSDPALWNIDRFEEFIDARRELIRAKLQESRSRCSTSRSPVADVCRFLGFW